MAINIVGTYVSKDEKHILNITESVSSVGQFKGEFTAKDTPEGEVVYQIQNNGDASWAYTSDQAHAGIGFMVADKAEKTSDRQFVIFDSWAGSITSTNKLLMSGSRSYTKNNGEYSVFSFNNVEFIKQ